MSDNEEQPMEWLHTSGMPLYVFKPGVKDWKSDRFFEAAKKAKKDKNQKAIDEVFQRAADLFNTPDSEERYGYEDFGLATYVKPSVENWKSDK